MYRPGTVHPPIVTTAPPGATGKKRQSVALPNNSGKTCGIPCKPQAPSTGFLFASSFTSILDIAARRFRVRADRVRLRDERFGLLLVGVSRKALVVSR
jgi:hypothetical protein